ncbi:MAG TPA: hypothetical protein VF785_01530 [Gemmatimonadaceae bacterium]
MTVLAPGRSRDERIAALLAGLVILGIGLALIDALPVGVAFDDAMYVILAKALATGQGYRWLNLPGMPPATHFPPGYPALLAVIWRVFPSFPANVIVFKAMNALLLAIAGATMVVFMRRRFGFSPLASVVLSIAGCAVIPALVLSTSVLSEPFFLAVLVPILLVAESVVEGDRPTRDLIALGLLAGIATLIRTHGIAIIAGIALALVLRPGVGTATRADRAFARRSRLRDAFVVVACAVMVMLPWQLWVRANQGFVPEPMRGLYESYSAWMARGIRSEGVSVLWRTSVRTSTEIAGMFATLATPFAYSWARLVALVALGVLLAAGLRRSWRTAPVTTLFLAVYSAIVIVWPFGPTRFVWGIWPLFVLVFVLGAVELKSWAPRRPAAEASRALLLACSLFVAVGYARYNARGYREHWWSRVARSQSEIVRPVVMWARNRTQPREVIASTVEPAVYLYSGRLAVPVTAFNVRDYFRPPTVAETETALRQILAGYRVDAIAIGSVGDSLRVALQSMASRKMPELVVRDSFLNGIVFAPSTSLRASSPHPAHQ